jgi:hypothetical protein
MVSVRIRRGGEIGARVEAPVDLEQQRFLAEVEDEVDFQLTELDFMESFIKDMDLTEDERSVIFKKLTRETMNRLRWKDSTASYKKINDVELFVVSGYDTEFVRTHQDIAALIDTAIQLQQEGVIAGIPGDKISSRIFEAIKSGRSGEDGVGIMLDTVDEHGEKDGLMTDLYDEVHLRNAKKLYDTIPRQDREFTWDEIETRMRAEFSHIKKNLYAAGRGETYEYEHDQIRLFIPRRDDQGNIVMSEDGKTPKGELIKDLYAETERITVKQSEFEDYYSSIEEYQTGLQDLSTYRDQSTSSHHSEKAGHAIFMEGIGGKFLYLPSSIEQAKAYATGDVPKTSVAFRAEGHPHEYAHFNEDTGICVGWERKLFQIFRGKVKDHYAFGKTAERNYKVAMGYAQTEDLQIDKQENKVWFGRREMPNGSVKYGLAYSALESHHDQNYKELRGSVLNEYEKGDMIMTDIVGSYFAMNPHDWIMAYYSATGLASPEKAMRSGQAAIDDEKGQPTLVFYCKLPPGGATEVNKEDTFAHGSQSNDYGELQIKGFTALAKYIEWRVSLGEVANISSVSEVEVDIIENIKSTAQKGKAGEKVVNLDAFKKEKENAERTEFMDHTEDAELFGSVLEKVFDTQWVSVMNILAGEKANVTVIVGGEEKILHTDSDITKYIGSVLGEHKELFERLKKTSKEFEANACARYYIKVMKDIATYKNVLKPNILKSHVNVAGASDVVFKEPEEAPKSEQPEQPETESENVDPATGGTITDTET